MQTSHKKRCSLIFFAIVISCSTAVSNETKKVTEITSAANTDADKSAETTTGKAYFSCLIDGAELADNTGVGFLQPATKLLTMSGENETYSVTIAIPASLKVGEICSTCVGSVAKKIKHEGNIIERQNFGIVESIQITLNERKKGYAAGTFSFVVKPRLNATTKRVVTNGKFGMNITDYSE